MAKHKFSEDYSKITSFVDKLKRIGIEVELVGNFPWIYLDKINGKRVKPEDYFMSEHGFHVAWYANKTPAKLVNIGETFKLIRKYVENE